MDRKWAILLLLAGMVWAPLGCKKVGDELSEYPFYLKTLDDRLEFAVKNLHSDQPNISLPHVLLADMNNAVVTMRDNYQGANRDAAMAKLDAVRQELERGLGTVLRLTPNAVFLLPEKKASDVTVIVDKMYEKYKAEFHPLVKGK